MSDHTTPLRLMPGRVEHFWGSDMHLQVIPGPRGQRLPWYFPFLPSYWRPADPLSESPESQPLSSGADAADPSAAVSIRHLHKVFAAAGGAKTHALDGLSLDMHHGQITALLGERPPHGFYCAICHGGKLDICICLLPEARCRRVQCQTCPLQRVRLDAGRWGEVR